MELYQHLEIEKDASEKEIKDAYRRLAKIHHPDKNGKKDDFQKIQLAYEVLSDPKRRAEYDKNGTIGIDDPQKYFTEMAVTIFNQTIANNFDAKKSDLFGNMRDYLKIADNQLKTEQKRAKKQGIYLTEIKSRIKTDAKNGLFTASLNQILENLETKNQKIKKERDAIKEVKKMILKCEYEKEDSNGYLRTI